MHCAASAPSSSRSLCSIPSKAATLWLWWTDRSAAEANRAGPSRGIRPMIAYEQQLANDRAWALREGSMHFDQHGRVHQSLERIAARLPYCIVGGMCLFVHGYRRFTEDINLLVTAAGLEEIQRQLTGRG